MCLNTGSNVFELCLKCLFVMCVGTFDNDNVFMECVLECVRDVFEISLSCLKCVWIVFEMFLKYV